MEHHRTWRHTPSRVLPWLLLAATCISLIGVSGSQPASAAAPPANRQAVRTSNPAATDGSYVITVAGRVLTVYCRDMATMPKEYLSLVNTGPNINFSQYTAGGASPGTNVRTNYTKVRLDPVTLKVNISDQTFASSTGQLVHSGATGGTGVVTSIAYAVAGDCSTPYGTTGLANIDLTGTPLVVNNTFVLGGFLPAGSTSFGSNNQTVNLTGGGYCGANMPDPNAGLFNPSDAFYLQLGFLPDAIKPTITITTPANNATYMLNQVVNAAYSCADEPGGFGLASCVGTVANGTPISTAAVGSKSFTVNAVDNAGNMQSAAASYTVLYSFTGFLQPVDNAPTLNTTKAGSAVPVKFSLAGNQGLNIFAAGSPTSRSIACDATAPPDELVTVTAGNSSLTYDATANQYTYVWKTDAAWAGSCRQLVVTLIDGSSHTANFKFR